jgi:hypothetical protein
VSVRPIRRHLRPALLAASLGVAACDGGTPDAARPSTDASPPPSLTALRVLDSIELEQPDTLLITDASAIAATADGTLLLADGRERRLLAYDARGRLLRQIGRQGGGPGEYSSITAIALAGDSLVVVQNYGARRVEAYAIATGAHRWGAAYEASPYGLAATGDRVVLAAMRSSGDSSTLELRARGARQGWIGPVPPVVAEQPMLAGPFGGGAVAARDSLTVMAFEATNRVYFRQGRRLSHLYLPAVRRRGAQEALLRAATRSPADGQAALYRSSSPQALGVLDEATMAIVHADVALEGTRFTGRHFVTLFRPGRWQVCLDIPLAAPEDPLPRFAFSGDTLLGAVTHLGDGATSRVFIKRFLLVPDACEWFGVSGTL